MHTSVISYLTQEPVPCYACCLASHHPLPESPSLRTRLHHALLCPPHGPPALFVAYVIALATIWAVAYCILGKVALPGTNTIEVKEERESQMQSQLLGFNPWWDSVLPPCSLDGVPLHGLGDGEIAYATPPWDAADRSNTSSYIPSSDQVLHSRIFPTSMWQEVLTLNGTLQLVPQLW